MGIAIYDGVLIPSRENFILEGKGNERKVGRKNKFERYKSRTNDNRVVLYLNNWVDCGQNDHTQMGSHIQP